MDLKVEVEIGKYGWKQEVELDEAAGIWSLQRQYGGIHCMVQKQPG